MKKRKKRILHIYLFRHGQTEYNKKGIFTGWKNSNLTLKGIRQAKTIARKLKNKQIDVAFDTRLTRAKQTLKYVLKYHPECKKIITDDRMIERKYGDLEGTTHKVFINKIGRRLINLEIEGDALENLSKKDRKKAEKFLGQEEYKLIHRGWNNPPPNGESFKMVKIRVVKFIKYLKKFMKKEKVNVAISSHGNSIRLFRHIWEKAGVEETTKWFIPYDKVYEYSVNV